MTGFDEEGSRFTYHGGNLGAARAAFPAAPEPWLDLSTGINALPYPVPTLAPALWATLPEPGALQALEAVAARAYGVPADQVVAAPGTQALIQRLPEILPARSASRCRVGLLGVTYAEHARVWRAAGHAVETVYRLAELDGYDLAVVVNPNNPDGRLVDPSALAATSRRVGFLVVDEAFVDVLPDGSSLGPARPDNAIVLRSFGKAYGLAGLRLGFALGSLDMATRLRRALGPWAVSGPAIAIGSAALADTAWLEAATARLGAAAQRLDRLLVAHGADVIGGTPLFRLVTVEDAARWFVRLAGAGILVRPFARQPEWLRFGVPGDEPQWERLDAALRGLDP